MKSYNYVREKSNFSLRVLRYVRGVEISSICGGYALYSYVSCYFCFPTLQVIAFSDEEGVRFQSTFLGSAAVAGILPVSALKITDKRFPWTNPIIYLFAILLISNVFMCNPCAVM